MDLTKAFDHGRGPFVIEESVGTGVPPHSLTAFFRLGEFTDLSVLMARTDAAA